MKLASLLILISTLCLTALAMADEWPQTARAPRVYRRRDTPTNAELLKRGLTPSRPRKMYEAKALEARQALTSTPSQATAGQRVYRLSQCRSNFVVSGSSNVVVFTDLNDLANKCAAIQDNEGRSDPQQFAIRNTRDGRNCWTAANLVGGDEQSCDTTGTNFAIYTSL